MAVQKADKNRRGLWYSERSTSIAPAALEGVSLQALLFVLLFSQS
jgi:hypothetical protein